MLHVTKCIKVKLTNYIVSRTCICPEWDLYLGVKMYWDSQLSVLEYSVVTGSHAPFKILLLSSKRSVLKWRRKPECLKRTTDINFGNQTDDFSHTGNCSKWDLYLVGGERHCMILRARFWPPATEYHHCFVPFCRRCPRECSISLFPWPFSANL